VQNERTPARVPVTGAAQAPPPDAAPLPQGTDAAGVALAGGHHLRLTRSPDADVLRVEGADGRLRLSVSVTAAGLAIELEGADLLLRAAGALAIDAERLTLRAREGLALESGGDLELRAEGAISSEAHRQSLLARRGDVAVRANDDVRLDGERIRMNC
jgi:hypothetical protein